MLNHYLKINSTNVLFIILICAFLAAFFAVRRMKGMARALEYRDKLLHAVNQVAGLLLNSDVEAFETALQHSMNMIAETARVNCVYLWKNHTIDGELYCSQLFEWSAKKTKFSDGTPYKYDDVVPGWKETLSAGNRINTLTRDMSPEEQKHLLPEGILSILVMPIFIGDLFWGFVGFDDCKRVRVFTKEEESILHSASILIANSFIRNEMTYNILDTSARLEAALNGVQEATRLKNNTLTALESILNSINAAVYVTVPATGELLFVNTWMKKAYNIESGDAIGSYCYKMFRSSIEGRCELCPCRQLEKEPDTTVVWEEYIPELNSYIRHSDCLIDWPDGSKVHLQHSVDITEMVESAEHAQTASRAKSDFLANMSHEMRTPMNAIVGMTAIGKKAATIEGKNSALDKIDDASSHLLGVINDILDMAKIEADKLELTLVEYSFEKLVQRVLSVIAFRADEKRQKLAVNISDEIPRCVVGDAQHLAQVITNLLSNAVKFTSEGGEIHLDAFAAQGQTGRSLLLRVEVTDNGIGISREQQEKMFDAFEQVQSGTSREHGGTGLGLAISKRIIELMGGRIWVESELGKGAKFIFTVEVQRGTSNGGAGSATQTAAESAPHNYFPGKRLLIAEDIAINRQILVTLLEDSGLAIDCAETGSEALELVAAAPDKYDIVFMDLQMPHMNGLEATRHIRALPAVMRRRKKLPIIAMTANVFKEDIAACRAAGMDDHLSKPLDIAKMQDVLRTYLGED